MSLSSRLLALASLWLLAGCFDLPSNDPPPRPDLIATFDLSRCNHPTPSPDNRNCQACNLENCNGACVDLSTDSNNCGQCGFTCPHDAPCTFRGPTPCQCPGRLTWCGGECLDLQAFRPVYCGTCGPGCLTGVCAWGQCCPLFGNPRCRWYLACGAGTAECNGACVSSTTTESCGDHCDPCGPRRRCVADTCACLPGETDCASTGCRALASDPGNCGACGLTCSFNMVCSRGTCAAACDNGLTNCGGACVDLAASNEHCGACGAACVGGTACDHGACQCAPGFILCGGLCVHPASDPANCNGCGHACAWNEGCVNGACQCLGRTARCNGSCVQLDTDTDCGACGNACINGKHCTGGVCY